eukprot:Rhum_TRINITY_DN17525_c0_g1::Rhum_TRINITY_DN17525_c0_g1_i1::g.166136::m.166136
MNYLRTETRVDGDGGSDCASPSGGKDDGVRLLEEMGFARKDSLAAVRMCAHAQNPAERSGASNALTEKAMRRYTQSEQSYVMAVFVRTDKHMTTGQIALMTAESCLKLDREMAIADNHTHQIWNETGRNKLIFACPSVELMEELTRLARDEDLPHHLTDLESPASPKVTFPAPEEVRQS